MKRKAVVLSVVMGLVLFVGCATLVNGGPHEMKIGSEPSDAKVKIIDADGKTVFNGSTPCEAKLNRGAGFFKGAKYTIEISKDGYKKSTVDVSHKLNTGWYVVGNFCFGGFLGWLIVDPISGSMWVLTPQDVNEKLEQSAMSRTVPAKDEIRIVLKQDIPEKEFEKLNAVKIN